MTTPTKIEPQVIQPDGRTKLAALLAGYDALKDEKDAAQKLLDDAKNELDAHTERIKACVSGPKVVLFTEGMSHPVQIDTGPQRRMTQADLDRFRADYPKLWLDYSTETTVCTLRRLTAPAWLRRFRQR